MGAHKAAECPDCNKCRRCHQPGHFAKDCRNVWGTTPQANRAAAAGPSAHARAHPTAPDPPAPGPPAPNPPALDPLAPSVSVDSAASSADPTVDQVLPPLMSWDIPAPQSSEPSEAMEEGSQHPASSQISLFSESDACQGSPPLAHPSSPSISEFTDTSDNSQSILRNIAIVSSDPKVVVEQIVDCNNSVSKSVSNDSLSGPKVAHNSNVDHPKVAGNNSNNSKELSGSKQSETTLLKLSQTRPAKFDFLSSPAVGTDSDSSSSESSFRPPLPPKPRRSSSQSPLRGRSRSPLVRSSPVSHRGIPQVAFDRPSKRS